MVVSQDLSPQNMCILMYFGFIHLQHVRMKQTAAPAGDANIQTLLVLQVVLMRQEVFRA